MVEFPATGLCDLNLSEKNLEKVTIQHATWPRFQSVQLGEAKCNFRFVKMRVLLRFPVAISSYNSPFLTSTVLLLHRKEGTFKLFNR